MEAEYLGPLYYEDYLKDITCPELQLRKLRELRLDKLNDFFNTHVNEDMTPENFFFYYIKKIFLLSNPLLVIRGLSIAKFRQHDPGYLWSYVSPLEYGIREIDDYDELYITKGFNDSEFQSILEFEEQYYSALIKMGRETVFNKPSLLSYALIPNHYKRELTDWDIYWGGWMSLNPSYENGIEYIRKLFKISGLKSGRYKSIAMTLMSFGYTNAHKNLNNKVHYAIEYYTYELNKIHLEINKSIANGNIRGEETKELLSKQLVIAKFKEIAQRHYYWNPEEISVHGCLELEK